MTTAATLHVAAGKPRSVSWQKNNITQKKMHASKIITLSLILILSVKAQPSSFPVATAMHFANCNKEIETDGIPMLTINKEGIIFVATYRNLYRSSDDGASWINIGKSLDLPGPYQFKKILPFDSTIVFLATAEHGIL